MPRRISNDFKQAGIAFGEDFRRPDLRAETLIVASGPPKETALLRAQRFQFDGSEQFEKRLRHIARTVQPNGGGRRNSDPGFRLESGTKLRAEALVSSLARKLKIL